jgi:DNA-binding LacI/PurR family transcriptional regulator
MAKQRATLVSIAKELNLSPSTVSYVLRGREKKVGISKETSAMVKEIARKVGYVPNHLARGLQGQRTHNISVLFISLKLGWSDLVMEGVEQILDPLHYSPLIVRHGVKVTSPTDTYFSGGVQAEAILKRRDEGVICQPHLKFKDDYISLLEAGVPVVFIGSLLNDMTNIEKASSVTWNCDSAVKAAIEHLIDTGRRKIAFFGAKHNVQSDFARYQAYEDALRAHSIPVNPKWVVWGPGYQETIDKTVQVEKVREMFSNSTEAPDAIFALNDSIALSLLGIIESIGIRVPEDVSIIGMGNLEVTGLHGIGLSTMEEPLVEMGKQAAETLLELIKNPLSEPIKKQIICNKLIVRRTTLL